ncbi:methylenetetrahydrofolate reductase [Tessaracoccus antarcticus]|uniref:Methylenetetrahydrofolate reductase n=1 Tax=Tessaracoccus antarcticus TaxID=2479848 RepID=A0A3M0G5Y0_9ACTN|nr:methylenetetrahydrofolate reductase [Tessaracoccus antarcticus]RMB60264.1 5,10-methylenetetrahydrofolate reductase [Tessaracoccus antarcticus]
MSAEPTTTATIADLLATATEPLLSFEFFPPRTAEEEPRFSNAVDRLERFAPDFVSVTYGASGSTRERTIDASRELARRGDVTVGHLTCVAQSRRDTTEALEAYRASGITNILAIRGDMPGGPAQRWEQHPEGLGTATELVEFIRDSGDFCVGVAAFPNVHQPDNDPELDARLVVEKARAGAQYAITQLFFEASRWVELVDRVRSRGCDIPIIPGIMPLTVITQIERFAALADCELPADFVAQLRAADNPAEVRRIGLERAETMCHELLEAGAPGLQFFTQNRWQATSEVISRLPLSRSRPARSCAASRG